MRGSSRSIFTSGFSDDGVFLLLSIIYNIGTRGFFTEPTILIDWYKRVTDYISDSQDNGIYVVYYINKMITNLNNSEIDTDDIYRKKLENQITATSNLLQEKHNSYTSFLLKFVKRLQIYITEIYGSVNDFLRDNDTQVKPTFADISEKVGFLIDPQNIEGAS